VPKEAEPGLNPVTGDALQFLVAADGTVYVQRVGEAHWAGMKTGLATNTPPRNDSKHTNDIVCKALLTRPAHVDTFADWASHSEDRGISPGSPSRIGQMRAAGKSRVVGFSQVQ